MLGVLLLPGACDRRKTDDLPHGDPQLTNEDLLRERRQIEQGKVVGEALRKVKILIHSDGVHINGRQVARPVDLDPSRLLRVEKVQAHTKGLREHWKMLHPAELFEGTAEVEVDPRLSAFLVASVLTTVVFSGFYRLRIRSGTENFNLPLHLPGPPREYDGPTREVRLRLRRGPGRDELAVLEGGPCRWDAARLLTRLAGVEDLPEIVRQFCSGERPCILMLDASGEEIGRVFKKISPLFEEYPKLRLVFSSPDAPQDGLGYGWFMPQHQDVQGDPGAPPHKNPPPASRGKLSHKISIKTGVAQTTGTLPSVELFEIIDKNMGKLRGCYEEGLTRNPSLSGRATVRFAVDLEGKIPEACVARSDMSDPAFLRCLSLRLGEIRVQSPIPGSAVVELPLFFSAE